jgi:hypothetical protein
MFKSTRHKKLLKAVESGDVNEIGRLAATAGLAIFEESADKRGLNALHHAVRVKSASGVGAIVRHAPAAVLRVNADGETPMDWAVKELPHDHIIVRIVRSAALHLAIERVRTPNSTHWRKASPSLLITLTSHHYLSLFPFITLASLVDRRVCSTSSTRLSTTSPAARSTTTAFCRSSRPRSWGERESACAVCRSTLLLTRLFC